MESDPQDIVGEDGQQRGDAAQQHRKQIETDGAEQQRLPPDQDDAGQQAGPIGALRCGRGSRPDDNHQEHRARQHDCRHGVDRNRRQRVEKAAQERTHHERHLEAGGAPGHRVGQILDRHQVRQHGAAGRRAEGARYPHTKRQQIERPHIGGAIVGDFQEHQRHQGAGAVADLDDPSAVEPVGGMAGQQHQQRHRQKFRQADQAEIQRIAGDLVYLPADHHGHHLHGHQLAELGEPVEREFAVAERGKAAARAGFGWRGAVHGAWISSKRSTSRSTGNIRVHNRVTARVSRAAGHHGGYRPQQRGCTAGHRATKFVRAADEHRLHGDDPPAQRIGSRQRHQCAPHIHAHHVGRAHDEDRECGQPIVLGDAEDDGRNAEDSHGHEQPPADLAAQGQLGQHRRRRHAAHRLECAEQAAPVRIHMEDVLGEDRDQRRGAGEQYGEQVQRDRAQQQLVAMD